MAVTFREIKADILGKITRGEWRPGELIPGELDLAESYGSARATVNRAMRELADDGIIERKRKSGSRVRLSPVRQARFDLPILRRELEEQGYIYRYALVRSEVVEASDWLRARLSLAPGVRVLHLVCLHFADGTPWQHEDRWINLDLLPQALDADFTKNVPTEWLVSQIPFSSVEISISATAADAGLAAHLGCATGDPLLMTERSTRWNAQTVTFVRLVHRPGHRMTTQY
ncbi:MAG: UTRA domain-containing protein [Rhodobacterales bacterium]|nr:UTRA domain-containing protein [Rhodobacterales bacterium]